MKFGLHFQLPCAPHQSPTERVRDTIEQAVAGEAMGFESVWPVEQHFSAEASILPSPLLLLSAIAARTTTLRLGTAILLLPLAHPLRVAEDIAMLDVLSDGRAECGVGRGMDPTHFAGFGIGPDESAARFREALEILRRAWAGGSCAYQGRYWTVPDVELAPGPVQRPAPPVRVAANSAPTLSTAGSLGLPVLVAGHVNPLPTLVPLVQEYREARAAAGHDGDGDITLLLPVFVARRAADVRRAMEPGLSRVTAIVRQKIDSWLASLPQGPMAEAQRVRLLELRARFEASSYERFSESMALFATADEAGDRLAAIRRDLGVERVIAWFNPGGLLPHAEVLRSMELFATTVMPQLTCVERTAA